MAGVPQTTLNWLYDVLSREYRDPNRTYSDLAQTLARYPGFAPRSDVYTFENGASALLVNFTGTIPVNFRGTVYRFPIILWVPHAYPYEAPLIYVKPTDDMVVRPGQHVSGEGKIYHHYLAHWREAWDRSNVAEFLSVLSEVFAKEPPVMSRQQATRRPQGPPAVPPSPQDSRSSWSALPGVPPSQNGRPPPPPKEPTGINGTSPSTGQRKAGRYDAPPPLPQAASSAGPSSVHPRSSFKPSIPQQQPQRNESALPHPIQSHLPQQRTDSPTSQYSVQQFRPVASQGAPPLPQNPSSSWSQRQGTFSQLQQATIPQQSYQLGTPQQYPDQSKTTYKQQAYHIQVATPVQPLPQQPAPKLQPPPDLLSSPFDIALPTSAPTSSIAAPPLPPNPEKAALLTTLSSHLTQTLHYQIAQNTSALAPLQSQHAALLSAHSALMAEASQFSSLSGLLQSNISILQSAIGSANKSIADAKSRAARGDVPKVDEMLTAPTVVARQLYDVVCEERGIEAGMWALQEGFVRGRIALDVWARKTRELAREGFRRKWLERKIARGMALDGA